MDKTNLVLLPGLSCNELLWKHQIEHLSDIADIIVADLSKDSSISDMAKRVLQKFNLVNIRFSKRVPGYWWSMTFRSLEQLKIY